MSSKVLSSFIWKFLERSGTHIIQFILQIILARILSPDDYGIVAIVTVFITLANVFIQNGFNTALIQKKDVDDLDYSSVFYLSFFVAIILYAIIFVTSPIIAKFYGNSLLISVLRVLSTNLFFGVFNSIQHAIISKRLQFKKYFISSLISIILSGLLGIYLAYNGYGVWALVYQQLCNIIINVIVQFIIVKWHPKLMFSFKRVKVLFSYGWKLLCSSLIDNLYTHIYDLVIGKKYTTSDLAFYNRGKQFPYFIVNNVNSSISSVLLPVMSIKQDDHNAVKRMMRRSIVVSSYIMIPMMFGLVVVAEPMVSLILTNKWSQCVPFLQILCFSYALWPIHTANLQAINAVGRSDIFLKLEVIKKIFGIIVLLVTIPLGLYAMAWGQIFSSIVSSFINSYPNKKLLNYGYIEQVKDILPAIILSLVMMIIISLIGLLKLNNVVTILFQLISGIIIYVLFSYIFKLEGFVYLLNILKKIRKKEL